MTRPTAQVGIHLHSGRVSPPGSARDPDPAREPSLRTATGKAEAWSWCGGATTREREKEKKEKDVEKEKGDRGEREC